MQPIPCNVCIQYALYWTDLLRPDAEILLLRCVPTHCSCNCPAPFRSRDALNNTIAPRLFPQGHTQIYYRAASFSSGTHSVILSRRVLLLKGRTFTSVHLRPYALLLHCTCVRTHCCFTAPVSFGHRWFSRLQEQPRQSDLQFWSCAERISVHQ